MFYATDAVSLGDVRVSDGGYLEAFAHTARTGIQQYLGAEMGRPDLGVVNVYRDAADVFSHASLHSFAKVPVTVDHPPGGVSAANWKAVAVGTTGEEVLRDGERLKIGLKIMDAAAIDSVRAGKRELSVGYRTEIVWGDGTAPDGTPYQARQTNIVADHVAIVTKGRAGAACRIGDSWAAFDAAGAREPGNPVQRDTIREKVSMKTLTIDGHPVELSDAAVIAVSNLQKQLGTAVADALAKDTALQTALSDHAKAISAKDTALADAVKAGETKDGEIAALKKQLEDAKLTPQKLDAARAVRDKVVADAERIVGKGKITFDGKPEDVIRREAVAHQLGDVCKDWSDEAINGAFVSYASKAPTLDHLGRTISASVPSPGQIVGDASAAAYDEMCRSYDAAWKRQTQGNS